MNRHLPTLFGGRWCCRNPLATVSTAWSAVRASDYRFAVTKSSVRCAIWRPTNVLRARPQSPSHSNSAVRPVLVSERHRRCVWAAVAMPTDFCWPHLYHAALWLVRAVPLCVSWSTTRAVCRHSDSNPVSWAVCQSLWILTECCATSAVPMQVSVVAVRPRQKYWLYLYVARNKCIAVHSTSCVEFELPAQQAV